MTEIMREIKVRGWDTKRKKMWSAEELGRDQLTLSPDGRGFVNVSGMSTRMSQFLSHIIPLEYTGLKDKNGVEIYGGDIICYSSVELEDDKGVVEYEVRRYAGFSLKSIQTRQFSFLSNGNNKVIGNKHQNPELLEPK